MTADQSKLVHKLDTSQVVTESTLFAAQFSRATACIQEAK